MYTNQVISNRKLFKRSCDSEDETHTNKRQKTNNNRLASAVNSFKYEETSNTSEQDTKISANKRLQILRNKIRAGVASFLKPKTADSHGMQKKINETNSINKNSIQDRLRNYSTAKTIVQSAFIKSEQNNRDSTDSECMDWEEIDDNLVLTDINTLRDRCNCSKVFNPKAYLDIAEIYSNTFLKQTSENKSFYIVIDTNIFISSLQVVKNIINNNTGNNSPVILIPWMVTQELDYIKDNYNKSDRSVCNNARVAINFINKHLKSENSKIKGQCISDVCNQKFSSSSADDSILFCCLQAKEKGHQVILLSNDVHLRNKAMINEIPAYGKNEIIVCLNENNLNSLCQVKERNDTTNKIDKVTTNKIDIVKEQLSILFGQLIIKEMIVAYGRIWKVMVKFDSSNPWSFYQCLQILEKYWSPVFSFKVQKQCLKIIQDLNNFNYKGADDNELFPFIDLAFALCFYFKNGYPDHAEYIDKCICQMKEIKSC